MATLRLNDRRVEALKPRNSAYDIRDRDLKGFGVRVLPWLGCGMSSYQSVVGKRIPAWRP